MKKYAMIGMSVLLLFVATSLHADLEFNIPFDTHVVSDFTVLYQSEYFDVINQGITDSFTIKVGYDEIPDYWSLGWCHVYQGSGSCHVAEYPWEFKFDSGDTLKLEFNIILTQMITSGDSMDFYYTFTASSLPEPVVLDFSFTMRGLSVDDPNSGERVVIKNAPNPFAEETTISFSSQANVHRLDRITIYNVKGEAVRTLELELSAAGLSTVWDGRDDFGRSVSNGIYFYRFVVDNLERTQKLILMR